MASSYLFLDRLEDARSVIEQAWAKKLDTPNVHNFAYVLAVARNDQAGMEQQAAWILGKPGIEDGFISWQSILPQLSQRNPKHLQSMTLGVKLKYRGRLIEHLQNIHVGCFIFARLAS